jgi:hypothetical protein
MDQALNQGGAKTMPKLANAAPFYLRKKPENTAFFVNLLPSPSV